MIRLLAAIGREVAFFLGEYGGELIDKLTGVDYVAREAEIRESIRRQAEGL